MKEMAFSVANVEHGEGVGVDSKRVNDFPSAAESDLWLSCIDV